MITLDTARKLKDAGLVWRLERGDMFHSEDADGIYVADGDRMMDLEEDIWLPRLDQILAEIEGRGHVWDVFPVVIDGKVVITYACEVASMATMDSFKAFGADTPEEATGMGLLWILENKEGK